MTKCNGVKKIDAKNVNSLAFLRFYNQKYNWLSTCKLQLFALVNKAPVIAIDHTA